METVNIPRLYDLLNMEFPLPRCRIQCLSIICPIDAPMFFLRELELNSWLRYWPTVAEVDIMASTFVTFRASSPNLDLKRLFTLPFSKNVVHLLDIAKAFPNLKKVFIPDATTVGSHDIIRFSSLHSLQVDLPNDDLWRVLCCPVLQEVTTMVDFLPLEAFTEFWLSIPLYDS